MKRILLIIAIAVLILLGYFFSNYQIKTVCFGDICPDNGGTFIFYRGNITKEECLAMGGNPIVGIGWTEVYAGCSPLKNEL